VQDPHAESDEMSVDDLVSNKNQELKEEDIPSPRNRGGDVTSSAIRKLVQDQGYRCALSGRSLTPDVAVVDHKVPLSRGGENVMDNLDVVHFRVNTAKGTMTTDEFVAMCIEVARYAGRQ